MTELRSIKLDFFLNSFEKTAVRWGIFKIFYSLNYN